LRCNSTFLNKQGLKKSAWRYFFKMRAFEFWAGCEKNVTFDKAIFPRKKICEIL
jgi:hypothetical protein